MRKFWFACLSKALLVFPGGFEILTLAQIAEKDLDLLMSLRIRLAEPSRNELAAIYGQYLAGLYRLNSIGNNRNVILHNVPVVV